MNEAPESKTFQASDESINTYGFRVLTSGIDTTAFESNPVMLYMHKRGRVFGCWSNLQKADSKLLVVPVCDTASKNARVQEVADQVERGVLKAASIGIDIQEVVWNETLSCYDVTRCILEEISIVDIPSNRNAVRLYANGKPLSEAELKDKLVTLAASPVTDTIQITNTPVHMELKRLAVKLGLPEAATESDVEAALGMLSQEKGFKKKFEDLEGQVKLAKEQERDQLITDAISDKRITADQKETYVKLFAADHDAAKAALLKMNKPVDLNAFVNSTVTLSASLSKDELVKLYDQKDQDGSMVKLKAENPNEYTRLFEAKWGRKPSA